MKTRPDFHAVAREVLDLALQRAGLKETDLNYIATTGFGRYNVPFRDVQITDITCVGRAAVFLFPKTRCVLDIGAQSTRALRVSDTGKVREFRTNDKCAAGAGGFIERACKYLEVNIDQVGDLSIQANKPQTISSVCAVLAESEIINHVSNGETIENILRGVHNSLASRALALLKRSGHGRRGHLRRRRGAAKRNGKGAGGDTQEKGQRQRRAGTGRGFGGGTARAPPPGKNSRRSTEANHRRGGKSSVMELQGKTALIAGGGGGIGRAVALALARAGAKAAVADIVKDERRESER